MCVRLSALRETCLSKSGSPVRLQQCLTANRGGRVKRKVYPLSAKWRSLLFLIDVRCCFSSLLKCTDLFLRLAMPALRPHQTAKGALYEGHSCRFAPESGTGARRSSVLRQPHPTVSGISLGIDSAHKLSPVSNEIPAWVAQRESADMTISCTEIDSTVERHRTRPPFWRKEW